MDGILQHILSAIGEQNLFLWDSVDLAKTHRDNTFLTLVVDAGVETECLRIETLDSLDHFLAGLKVKLVSVEIVHNLFHSHYLFIFYLFSSVIIQ